jgi:hypothetical protein
MYPVNQVILGGDPILSQMNDFDTQMQMLELQKKKLQQLKQQVQTTPKNYIWDEIDAEIRPLSEEQKERLMSNRDYVHNYNSIQALVQAELINLIKGKIESTPEGKELLQSQLKLARQLKGQIIEDTNREMQTFKKFKEFSKTNPGVTYEEFIKASM